MFTELAKKLLTLLQNNPDVLSFSASHLVAELKATPLEILAAAEELEGETRWRDDYHVSVTHQKNYADQTVDYEVMLIPLTVSSLGI